MRRHSILRDIKKAREFAGGHSVRFMSDEKPEGFKPCGLGQSGERRDRRCDFHISRLMDIFLLSMAIPEDCPHHVLVHDADSPRVDENASSGLLEMAPQRGPRRATIMT